MTLGTATFNAGTNTFTSGSAPCVVPGGNSFGFQQVGIWKVNATGQRTPQAVPPVANQTSPLAIANIRGKFIVRTGTNSTCAFDIGGTATNYGTAFSPVTPSTATVTASYKNGAGGTSPSLPSLALNAYSGNVHAFNVPPGGCLLGALQSGDALSIEGVSGGPATSNVKIDNAATPANPVGTADQMRLSI